MRLDTNIWIRMESKGRPAETKQLNLSVRESILAMAQWLANIYMGSHIDIRIARCEADLHRTTREAEMATLGHELDALLEASGGTPESESGE